MPKIVKRPVKLRDPEYKRRKATQRESDQNVVTDELLELAASFIKKYDTDLKRSKYTKYFDISDRIDPKYRKVFRQKFLSSRRLRFNEAGELTLESGRLRPKRKILKRDAKSGEAYLGGLEKESWRQKAGKPRKAEGWTRDKDGNILAGYITRADGRFNERWELDEKGKPIRTKYFTNRKRDGRFFRSISEDISKPYESGLEKKEYRTLTRRKGSNEKVYERDADGNLELIGRKKLGYSWASRKSNDRKTSIRTKERLWGLFSKSYQLLLDENGNELAKDITARRRFLSKRSATFDKETNQQTSSQHKVGKFLYKNDTDFQITEGSKVVTRRILGLKRTKTVFLTPSELEAQKIGKEEAAEHKQHWADVAERLKTEEAALKIEEAARQAARLVKHPPPAPGTTRQLGSPPPSGVDLTKPQPPRPGVDLTKPPLPPTFGTGTSAAGSGSSVGSIGSATPSPGLSQASNEVSSTAPSSNVERLLATLAGGNAAGPPATPPPADPAKRLTALQQAAQRRDAANGSAPVKEQPSATPPADSIERLNALQEAAQRRDAANGSASIQQPPPGLDLSKPQPPPGMILGKQQLPPGRQQPAPAGPQRPTALSALAAAAQQRDTRAGDREQIGRG